MSPRARLAACLLAALAALPGCHGAPKSHGLTWEGGDGPGKGWHVVLVAGDEEYRSEEALPALAAILSERLGFTCTVLFSIDPQTGAIDPEARGNIPGLEVLAEADLLVLFTRFRRLPDDAMAHLVRWVEDGRPVIGLRTATHAFAYPKGDESPFAHWSWDSQTWPGGFGQQVLGTTWVAHHGRHGTESTRGRIDAAAADHPVLRGVTDVWGPTDVYAVRELPADATVLLEGLVLTGMDPGDPPVEDGRNAPPMPLVWLRQRPLPDGRVQRVVASTIGAAIDLQSEDLRRLLANACFWALGLEDRIPSRADVLPVGAFEPSMYGFGSHRRGLRPADLTGADG